MSETYSVYNQNGTLANELARCRVVKISTGVYTWDIVGGSASSTSEESIVADDNYSIIRAEIPSAERAGVPIEWAVNSAKDFYVVAICEENIIDGLSDGAFSYDAEQKVLWLECPFENAKEWIAYIFRAEHPVNNFAIAEGRARISAIQAQFEKDNRILRQLDAQIFRTLRTCDPIKTLPPKEQLIGKVLAFGEDGNPDLSLSKEDVEGAYLARDEAKELKNKTETLKNETAELKSDAESFKNYAVDAASKAVLAQGKAEEAEGNTQVLKSSVEATVSEFNSTVNTKVQEVESAAQSGITAVNSAKTAAVGEISTIKSEVETAGANAVNEVNAATEEAKAVIDGWTEQSARLAKAESAISLLQADKANSGALWFNKGKLTTATNNATTLPLTLCATYECADLSSGYFNFLATHKVSGWTSLGQTGSTSGFGFGVINNENYVNRIFGVKLSTPDATDIHVARHGYDYGVWLKSDSFEKFVGRHTFIATISEEITNGVPKIVLYFDGSVLSTNRNFKYNGGLQSAELGMGQGKISTGSTEYSPTNISTTPVKLSRLKIFNCVLPATKADDVNGIGYTVEDYHNGVDEPPTMQDASATYRALLSLQDYVFNGEVLDASGNGNHASITVSEGGSVRGTNDNAVETLFQKIATRISNATVE